MESINLNRLAYFAAVADAGSFTRAAERLGITKTVVSQQVAKLEDELKTTLLIRTTRRVEPTEAGRLLHARCVMILREAEDAFDELARSNLEPKGMLRVAAPNDFGTFMIAPLAAEFTRRFRECRVELVLSDSKVDLLERHIDLSVRVGWLDDSGQQARRIASFRQVLVAAPQIAATLTADLPEQLTEVPFIANGALRDPLTWHFARNDFERRTVHFRSTISINSTPAVLAATLAAGGLSVLPEFLVEHDLHTGSLVNLLPAWSLPSGGIHVVYPAARYRPPKVTAFVTMLVERMKKRSA